MLLSTLNFGEILREFGEILGKYRILDDRSVGSIGLMILSLYSLTFCKESQNHMGVSDIQLAMFQKAKWAFRPYSGVS